MRYGFAVFALLVASRAFADPRPAQAEDLAIAATAAEETVAPGGALAITLTVTNTSKDEVIVTATSTTEANVSGTDERGRGLGPDGEPRPTRRCRLQLERLHVNDKGGPAGRGVKEIHLAPGEAHVWTGTFVARRYRWDRRLCPPDKTLTGPKLRPGRYHVHAGAYGALRLEGTVDVTVAR